VKGTQCCGNCGFWDRHEATTARTGVLKDGLCLAHPPQPCVMDDGVLDYQPDTYDDDWCGEWRAENPDTADAVLLATARAVLAGDLTAARAMADRLHELGG
jgi:hypothetical protein